MAKCVSVKGLLQLAERMTQHQQLAIEAVQPEGKQVPSYSLKLVHVLEKCLFSHLKKLFLHLSRTPEENQREDGQYFRKANRRRKKQAIKKSTCNLLETSAFEMSAASSALFFRVPLINSVRHMWNFRTSLLAMPFSKTRKN